MRELIDAMQDNYSKWQTREGIKNLPEYGGAQPSGATGRLTRAVDPASDRRRHPLARRRMRGQERRQPPRRIEVGDVLERDRALERDERIRRLGQLERVGVGAALDRPRQAIADQPDRARPPRRRQRQRGQRARRSRARATAPS